MGKYGAIATQMAHPTWTRTSLNFKVGLGNYATGLGLPIQGLNDR